MNNTVRGLLLAAVLLILLPGVAFGIPLSKIAVIDVDRVFASFPEDSAVFRRIDDLREQYDEWMGERDQQLDDIEREIDEARDVEDSIEVARLESRRTEIIETRRTYHEIMTRRIQEAYRELEEGEGIVQDILRAIELVAVDEGYSAVLESSDSQIWWFSKEVDITDLVIGRLRVISRAGGN